MPFPGVPDFQHPPSMMKKNIFPAWGIACLALPLFSPLMAAAVDSCGNMNILKYLMEECNGDSTRCVPGWEQSGNRCL